MSASKNWHYQDIIAAVLRTGGLPPHIYTLANVIHRYGLDRKRVREALREHGIYSLRHINDDLLDLLLAYLHLILDDHLINEEEYRDFELLKILFEIREGDFYQFRYTHIKSILEEQISIIWTDNQELTPAEVMLQTSLEDFFDLTFDQYLEFERHIERLPLRRSVTFEPKMHLDT
jgi:hypothetical protein